MDYGMRIKLAQPYATVVPRVREALTEQGFGVLTEIDVRATPRHKLGEEIEDYVILGACNPPLACRALQMDRQIGLLLPGNVVVRADGAGTIVEALDPHVMSDVAGRPGLKPVADQAARRLHVALAALAAAASGPASQAQTSANNGRTASPPGLHPPGHHAGTAPAPGGVPPPAPAAPARRRSASIRVNPGIWAGC